MKKADRKHLVISASIGLVALFIATIGMPLLAVLWWPPISANTTDSIATHMAGASELVQVTQWVSIFCFTVFAVCLLDACVLLAKWFIGQAPESSQHEVA